MENTTPFVRIFPHDASDIGRKGPIAMLDGLGDVHRHQLVTIPLAPRPWGKQRFVVQELQVLDSGAIRASIRAGIG
jgi:hypothetical protein